MTTPSNDKLARSWKVPPKIKIWEALGALADKRVINVGVGRYEVTSSSGNKTYEVTVEQDTRVISSNDNGSYWRGYLGYPAIAVLLEIGDLDHRPDLGFMLQAVKWKALNRTYESDYRTTLHHVRSQISERHGSQRLKDLDMYIDELHLILSTQAWKRPEGSRARPPSGW